MGEVCVFVCVECLWYSLMLLPYEDTCLLLFRTGVVDFAAGVIPAFIDKFRRSIFQGTDEEEDEEDEEDEEQTSQQENSEEGSILGSLSSWIYGMNESIV